MKSTLSSMPVAIKGVQLPTEVGSAAKLQSGQDPGKDNEHADELPREVFCQFVQKFFTLCKPSFISCTGG